MKKILIIATGGTIASEKSDFIRLKNPFKILDVVKFDNIDFVCESPFSVLSENMDFDLWEKLIAFINQESSNDYEGIIILHGSDTLAYTGALLSNIFFDKKIVLVASNKPIEEDGSNAVENFKNAVEYILNGENGVYISYDKLMFAHMVQSANSNDEFITAGEFGEKISAPLLHKRNILVIKPYININYNNYNINNVDVVLHEMYHSATAPKNVIAFIDKCKEKNIKFYFVTTKSSADYESAKNFENIIFNSTLENAYAKLLLTK